MARWYAAYEARGRPESIAEQVAALVRLHDLGAVVPLVRLERRPRGKFYLFLAIESEQPGELPPELRARSQYPILGEFLREGGSVTAFTLDEIRSMVSGEIDVHEYARRLRLGSASVPVAAEPFPAGDEPDEAAEQALIERSRRHDRLLLWLSAAGSGSRTTFFTACQSLGLARDGREAGFILRRLRLLGHVESSPDGERWAVAPAVLAELGVAAPQAVFVLCGERDPLLLQALHALAAVEETPQPGGNAPARVLVRSDDPERLERMLAESGLVRPPRRARPALRLAEVLPPLERWPSLLTAAALVPELYEWRRFNGQEFEPVAWQAQSGMYEYLPREDRSAPRDTRPAAVFYDRDRGAFLRGDWYGLRCLAQLRDHGPCPAAYEVLAARLAIPESRRPPELYERALVLASGRLPERRGGWLWYGDIELELVTLLAEKLHLALDGDDPDA